MVVRRAAVGDHDAGRHAVPGRPGPVHVPAPQRRPPHGEAALLQPRDVSSSSRLLLHCLLYKRAHSLLVELNYCFLMKANAVPQNRLARA